MQSSDGYHFKWNFDSLSSIAIMNVAIPSSNLVDMFNSYTSKYTLELIMPFCVFQGDKYNSYI